MIFKTKNILSMLITKNKFRERIIINKNQVVFSDSKKHGIIVGFLNLKDGKFKTFDYLCIKSDSNDIYDFSPLCFYLNKKR